MTEIDRTLQAALVARERELHEVEQQLRDATPNARDYSTGDAFDAAARLHEDMKARVEELLADVIACAWTFDSPQWNVTRVKRTLRRTSLPRRSDYDCYVVMLTSDEARDIANVLASIGITLDGVTLTLRDDDGVLAEVTPERVRSAHEALLDALQNRWLGTHT